MKTKNKEVKIIQFITFKIDGRIYAIDIAYVREINRLSAVTHVPRTDDFVDGVMNLRGAIIPVINVRKRLQISLLPYGKKNKLIIVEYDEAPVGLIVDEIAEVVKISADNIESDKEKMVEIGTEYVDRLGKTDEGILAIVNINTLLERGRKENAAV